VPLRRPLSTSDGLVSGVYVPVDCRSLTTRRTPLSPRRLATNPPGALLLVRIFALLTMAALPRVTTVVCATTPVHRTFQPRAARRGSAPPVFSSSRVSSTRWPSGRSACW